MSRKPFHLTADQGAALEAYIWQLRDLMGLHRWDLFIAAERAPKGARAAVLPSDGRAIAGLSFCKGWFDSTPDDMRNDIVHELIHIIHRDQTDLVRLSTFDVLERSTYIVLASAHKSATEVMVDHLTAIIAPFMPLPNFTKPQENP